MENDYHLDESSNNPFFGINSIGQVYNISCYGENDGYIIIDDILLNSFQLPTNEEGLTLLPFKLTHLETGEDYSDNYNSDTGIFEELIAGSYQLEVETVNECSSFDTIVLKHNRDITTFVFHKKLNS